VAASIATSAQSAASATSRRPASASSASRSSSFPLPQPAAPPPQRTHRTPPPPATAAPRPASYIRPCDAVINACGTETAAWSDMLHACMHRNDWHTMSSQDIDVHMCSGL